MFLSVISSSLMEEEVPDAKGGTSTRTVMKIHPALAPVKAAVLPLIKKDRLPEKAREVFDMLKLDVNVQYDEKDAIGRRYRRQDAIGTPFCITIDHDTLTDSAVTIRDRDSLKQERIAISDIATLIKEKVSFSKLFV